MKNIIVENSYRNAFSLAVVLASSFISHAANAANVIFYDGNEIEPYRVSSSETRHYIGGGPGVHPVTPYQFGTTPASITYTDNYATLSASTNFLHVTGAATATLATSDPNFQDAAASTSASYSTQFQITSGNAPFVLSIDPLYNATANTPGGGSVASTYASLEIRKVWDNSLILSYVFGKSDPNLLKHIELSHGPYSLILNAGTSTFATAGNTASSVVDLSVMLSATEVPLPSAAWLFASGLIGLGRINRRKMK